MPQGQPWSVFARRFAGAASSTFGSAALAGSALACLAISLLVAPSGGPQPWLFAPHLLLAACLLRSRLLLLGGLSLLATLSPGGDLEAWAAMPRPWLIAYLCSLAVIPLTGQALRLARRRERQQWRSSLEASGMGVAEWDLARQRCNASPGWQRLVGSAPEATEPPTAWLETAHPLDRARLVPQMEQWLNRTDASDCREPLRLRDLQSGEWRWSELHLQVQARDRRGTARRLLATLSDISWQRTAEERQRMSISLFQHLHEGLLVTDAGHQILDANPSYCRLIGLAREALTGQVAAPLQEAALRLSGHDPLALQQELAEQGHWQGLVHCQRGNGEACALQITVSRIPEPNGPVRYHVVTVNDLTQQMRQQAQLDHQARFDPLTGLPNPSEFKRLLEQALQTSRREGFLLCVCCLDLDQFKRVNELHGRATGDRLLGLAAERLRGALRSGQQWSDEVARLGGDEFGLLLRCRSAEEAQLAVERVRNVLRAPYHLDEHSAPLELSASLGATLFPQDHSDGETLQRHAAHALYRVKRSGRDGHEFFDTEKRLRNEARVLALGRMQQALDGNELQLYYQPKVDMRRGVVLGVEALLRWHHPERGVLGPAHFLPVVEQTGLAVQVGDWVIEQALKQSSQWLEAGLGLHVSVNVAARHLQADDFAQRLQELLARHREPLAEHLVLEVLESTALADIDATQALIKRCRALGVRFALDDFGTGYSTLTYLKRLPVDMLKIDRSFVQNMLIDAQDKALVEGVIGLASHFGCSVVAEGVETASHARALLAMGCDHGQGNGIAMAMPAAALPGWVAQFELSPVLAGRQETVAGIH